MSDVYLISLFAFPQTYFLTTFTPSPPLLMFYFEKELVSEGDPDSIGEKKQPSKLININDIKYIDFKEC